MKNSIDNVIAEFKCDIRVSKEKIILTGLNKNYRVDDAVDIITDLLREHKEL